MLRIYQSTQASEAKKYYTDALARQDYYVQGQEIVGEWGGKAAALLGLSGEVQQKAFANLCDNKNPLTGDRLTPRTRDDRTVGYDVNFHCPKGVSLLQALTRDARIVTAMRQAVAETMVELEANTHTRVRLNDRSEDRHTGNLAWGEFVHFTGRPVDGVPDPQLHIHCFVFNATWDSEEGRWKAAQFRQVVRDHPYFQAVFHTHLAAKLETIGYPMARTPEGWDVAGITRDVVEKFSRRTDEIEKAARRLGITDVAEKASLGARTRSKKDKTLGAAELARDWQQRLSEPEAEWLQKICQGPDVLSTHRQHGEDVARDLWRRTFDLHRSVSPDQALEHAISHVFSRNAVQTDRRLAAEALKFAVGDVSPGQIWQAIDQHPELLTRQLDGERWVTTRAVLQEEKAVLRFAVEGKGTCVPLGAGFGGRPGERFPIGAIAKKREFTLTDPQRAAIEHVLGSRDRVMLLRGDAGTGKTALLCEAAAAIQHGGTRVFACAVTTDASRDVLQKAGFKRADTVKALLTKPEIQEHIKDGVIWIDEAGMVGTPTLRQVFELAERQNARVILAGDTKQHAPIERGDGMKLLERQAGIRPAEIDEIIRQQGLYKQAMEALGKGRLAKAVEYLDHLGFIQEVKDPDRPEVRHQELADKYLQAVKEKRSALVVSPTHAEGKAVTAVIRETLKDAGRLDREERTFTRLKDTQWTEAQRADAHNYKPGMVVQYVKTTKGIEHRNIKDAPSGLRATILAVDAEKGFITTEDVIGNRRALPLDKTSHFQVFEPEEIKIAVGDQIRITHNTHAMGLKSRIPNGRYYGVKGFDEDGNIQLDNTAGWKLHRNIGHFNHGYCSTPQAAQGRSVDRCFAAVSAQSLSASNLEQLYVILSRGKQSVELLTDKRSALIEAVSRMDRHRSATELLQDTSSSTRRMTQMAHAFEVQRLKALEAKRMRVQQDRQRAHGQHLSPDRQRDQHRQQPSPRPPSRRIDKDPPARERDR